MLQSTPGTRDTLQGPHTTGGQDVAILFATRIGLVVLFLLIQGGLAWLLLPAGRGSYAACIAFGTLLGLFFTPGAQQGAQYFVMAGQTGVSQGVSSALAISLVGGGLAIAPAILLIHGDIAFFQKADLRSFHLALILIPLIASSTAVEHQLAALRRFGRLAVFSLLRAAVNVLAIAALVWGGDLGVAGAVASFAAGHLVMIAACLRDLRRHCGLAPALPSRSSLTRVLGYGLRYHIARVGEALEPHLGIFVLGSIAGEADMGLFAAASSLMLGFAVISNAVGNALLPRIAGRNSPDLTALCLRLVCGATAAVVLVVLAAGAPLVRFLLSDAFLQTVPLLWIMAPGIVAYAGTGIFMTHFKGVNRPDICSWAVGPGMCANLGAVLLLYPAFGVAAAAWAMTAVMACRCLLLAVIFRKTTRMAWLPIWLPRRSDASFLWAAGRSALAHQWRST